MSQEVKQLDYEGKIFFLPYADLIPAQSPEEIAALRGSVLQNGIKHRILHNHDGVVIDGGTRLEIALDLEIPLDELPLEEVQVDLEKALALAIQLNSCRRQWTDKSRAQVIHRLKRRGWSLRKIAEVANVSHTTVARDLEQPDPDAPEGTQVEHDVTPDRSLGRDGKSHPASKPPKPKPERGVGNPTPGEVAGPAAESTERHDVQSVELPGDKGDAAESPPKPQGGAAGVTGGSREATKLFTSLVRSCAALGKLELVAGDLQKIAEVMGLLAADRDEGYRRFGADHRALQNLASGRGVFQQSRAIWSRLYRTVHELPLDEQDGGQPVEEAKEPARATPEGQEAAKPIMEPRYEPNEGDEADVNRDYADEPVPGDPPTDDDDPNDLLRQAEAARWNEGRIC